MAEQPAARRGGPPERSGWPSRRFVRAGLASLCLAAACVAPRGHDGKTVAQQAPEWALVPPYRDGQRWIAAGSGRATTLERAEALAQAAARASLLVLRGVLPGQDVAEPSADNGGLEVGSEGGDGPASELDQVRARLAGLGARDELSLATPADGRHSVRRLPDGTLEVFLQVSADDVELFPGRSLQQAAALADGEQRELRLIELARTFLLRGMDSHCQVALDDLERDPDLSPATLVELAGLHLLLGRRDDALRANARALSLLEAVPAMDEALLARAREQQARLVSGIASVEDSLLDLERLTRATRRDDVLATSSEELLCEGAQASPLRLEMAGRAGRLAPLWIDGSGVRLVKLSDDGRVHGSALDLSLGLPPDIDRATLLVWLLPEAQSVLQTIDALRDERLPAVDGAANDEQRLLLQALLDGLRKAAANPHVGAAIVRLHR